MSQVFENGTRKPIAASSANAQPKSATEPRCSLPRTRRSARKMTIAVVIRISSGHEYAMLSKLERFISMPPRCVSFRSSQRRDGGGRGGDHLVEVQQRGIDQVEDGVRIDAEDHHDHAERHQRD